MRDLYHRLRTCANKNTVHAYSSSNYLPKDHGNFKLQDQTSVQICQTTQHDKNTKTSKVALPTHVLPSACSAYLPWHLQMGPCSVSSQMCWQPPLPWLQVTMQQNINSVTSTAPVRCSVVFLSLMVDDSHVRMQPRWFLASSKPGRHSQATPPLGVSLQIWAQPWSLFMQLRPSVRKRYRQTDSVNIR